MAKKLQPKVRRTYTSIPKKNVPKTKQTQLTSKEFKHKQTIQNVPKTKQRKMTKKSVKYTQLKQKVTKTRQTPMKFDDLSQIPMGEARKELRKRYKRTHPDSKKTAVVTFLYPNKLWKKNPGLYDVLGFDTKTATKVKKLPEKGLKGQVVDMNGKLYVYDARIKKFKLRKTKR